MMTMPDAFSSAVRPAVLQDLETLAVIDARCFPPGIAYSKGEIAALLRARTGFTAVAERSGTVVGFASVRLLRSRHSPLQPPRGELITIDVAPEFRRAHVGLELYEAMESWAHAADASSIELHVAVNNTAAIRFYERLGYSVIAQVSRYYLESIDAWRMQKALVR
jgi:ribosomal-protein-alanine N-acetyltransferase